MKSQIQAVDFFCSGGGMSCGIQQSGINVIAGIDIDIDCEATYKANIKNAEFIHADISELKEKELARHLPIKKNDDNMLFIGCSPCQYWTIIRTDKEKSQKSKNLLADFLRFIKYYKPGYVLVENVPGILTNKNESNIGKFIKNLSSFGYDVEYEIVDLSNYNIPQSRKRFSLIANRLGRPIIFPSISKKKKTVRDAIGNIKRFPKIPAGHNDSTTFLHKAAGLSEISMERLRMTPLDGGTRESWADTDLQIKAYKKNTSGFKDTYSRMFWDRPAPTITTKFFSISNGRYAHPEQHRAISLREGATLQTFPLNYKFLGTSVAGIAKIIGNAVPPKYARQLGEAIGEYHE